MTTERLLLVPLGGEHAQDLFPVLSDAFQCRGFATEAAEAMLLWLRCAGIREFSARIHPLHTASQRVAANVGLAPSGEMAADEQVWQCAE